MLVKIIKKFDYVVIHEAGARIEMEKERVRRPTGGKRSKRRIFIAFIENKMNEIKRLFKINRH